MKLQNLKNVYEYDILSGKFEGIYRFQIDNNDSCWYV